MSTPSIGGAGRFISFAGVLGKLRRDNALADSVHDAAEDEPHIVRSPQLQAEDALAQPDAVTPPAPNHRGRFERNRAEK